MTTAAVTAPEVASPRRTAKSLTGLTITQEDAYSCPLAFCDGCGAQIKEVDLAGVVWRYPKQKNSRARFRILCKDAGTGQPGYHGCLSSPLNKRDPWMELGNYLMSLLWNMGVKSQRACADLYERADVAARFE